MPRNPCASTSTPIARMTTSACHTSRPPVRSTRTDARHLTPQYSRKEIEMSNKVFIGAKEYFSGVGRIPFEGKGSDNPFAFKVYDEKQKVGDKTMREHLRFAVCYW